MELGATVCTPRAPSCSTCPVRAQCGAKNHLQRIKEEPDIEECDLCLPGQDYNQDLGVMNYPRKAKKTASRDQETLVVVVKKCGANDPMKNNQGSYEVGFPGIASLGCAPRRPKNDWL